MTRFQDVLCKPAQGFWSEGMEHWVPKSVVTNDSQVWAKGQRGDLTVEDWWAERAEVCNLV